LKTEFSVCDDCKIKKTSREENIDVFIKNIKEFTDELAYKLTKQQKLNIKCYFRFL